MDAWLNLCRWKNLSIITITQILVFLYLSRGNSGIEFNLNTYINVALLIFCTVLLAAGGFIVNDLFDEISDDHNKAGKKIIGNKISFRDGQIAYVVLVLSGNLIALLLSVRLNSFTEYLIYPLIVFLLWLYSYKLKCTPLAGNVFVSIFTSGVILIIPFAFRNELSLKSDQTFLSFLIDYKNILLMGLFSFGINLYREVVKDLEDLSGDHLQGCQTTAIHFGETKTRIISTVLITSQLAITFILIEVNLLSTILTSIPAVILITLPYTKIGWNYKILSGLSKLYMIIGLLYFLTLYHG